MNKNLRWIWDTYSRDARANIVPAIAVVLLPLLGMAAILWAVVGVVAVTQNQPQTPQGAASTTIPLRSQAAGVIEGFSCLNQGPSCSQYEPAKQYVSEIITQDFTHPADVHDATAVRTDNLAQMTDQQWHEIAQSVTADGAVSMQSVPENSIRDHGDQASFSIMHPTSGRMTATMRFTQHNSQWVLTDMRYTGEG